MKKRLVVGFVSSIALAGIAIVGGTNVQAAVTDSASTDIGIGFSGHGPGTTPGDLDIQWAPIGLDFSKSNMVNTTAVKEFSETTGTNKYVVVSEKRSQLPSRTWKLTAELSNLENAEGSETLTGAGLMFDATVKGYDGMNTPETSGSIVDIGARTAIVNSASQTVNAGATAVPVMQDSGSAGASYLGSTAMEMSNIKLKVPANSAKINQQYSGTLTWSLNDTI
ncbi:WxL domain-containing protein [Enterococcus faecalis]|uniref:WxL domain-containing protein n=1 Tax=Enterococcus faecalis TaxID=1351 RepID=UPI0013303C32|nr:WxL domain-containing protein [Enterococcus faecalis]